MDPRFIRRITAIHPKNGPSPNSLPKSTSISKSSALSKMISQVASRFSASSIGLSLPVYTLWAAKTAPALNLRSGLDNQLQFAFLDTVLKRYPQSIRLLWEYHLPGGGISHRGRSCSWMHILLEFVSYQHL